jgi:hypothetical protein
MRTRLRQGLRPALTLGLALVGFALVILGVAQIYPPAALIVAGFCLLGVLTFDPRHVRKLTWPR